MNFDNVASSVRSNSSCSSSSIWYMGRLSFANDLSSGLLGDMVFFKAFVIVL